VREIGACAAILTTSLHGLITADSFGIPALWTILQPELSGGDFKFLDYESVVTPNASRFHAFDERMTLPDLLAHTVVAPRSTVQSASDALEAAIGRLPEAIGELAPFPLGVPQVIAGRVGPGSR